MIGSGTIQRMAMMCAIICIIFMFFCFKQKTAYEMRISDWSSDVCSSDLPGVRSEDFGHDVGDFRRGGTAAVSRRIGAKSSPPDIVRSVAVADIQIGRAHV